MKLKLAVSKRCCALSVFALAAFALPCSAWTPPVLMFSATSAGVTYSVTIYSSGTVVYGGACSAVVCPGVPVIGPGYIVFTGTVGPFAIINAAGETKPYLASPSIDLGLGTVTSTAAGTLTAEFTDVGFDATGPVVLNVLTGGTPATYTAYIDPNNAEFGMTTTIGTLSNITTNTSVTENLTETTQPVSLTAVSTVTLAAGSTFSSDFGVSATTPTSAPPPSPMISISKSASATSVQPFQKVTYTYEVKNTGNTTLTNVTVTDDNATPSYTGDDFTVCTIASLAAGASQTCTASVYPPIKEGANDCGPSGTFNYNNYHPGGDLICQSLPNGDIQFTFLADGSVIDNTFGTGASPDWPSGNQSWMLAEGTAEFQVFDGKGNKVLDFETPYVSENSAYISGYGPGGISSLIAGSAGWIASIDTTASDSVNKNKATATCLTNSPGVHPDWINQHGYKVHVSCSAWGSNGFGSVQCPSLWNGYTKNSACTQHIVKPVNSTATNTATAIGAYGSTTVSAKATATVAIVANPAPPQCPVVLPPTCNVYGKAPSQCQPKNGGHDNDGYAYCDALLGTQLTCNNTPFVLGSASGPSAASGGTIPLPAGNYSYLKFLAAGVNGPQYNQPFIVTYTDGTTTTASQNLSDWCNSSGFSGETVAKTMPYRITPNGGQQSGTINIYQYSIQCNNTKTVKSVTLPGNRNVIVHAITMVP
jgi:hypothetical protein